jgi:hypothetical protein
MQALLLKYNMIRNYDFVKLSYDINELMSCLPDLESLYNPYGIVKYHCNTEQTQRINILLNLPWTIRHVGLFKLPPKSVGIIHTDSNVLYPEHFHATALNIGFGDTSETYMSWYKQVDTSKTIYDYGHNKDGTPVMQPNDAIKIERINVTTPHIIRINDWHSIDNDSQSKTGYILTLRFDTKHSYQELVSKLIGPA